MKNWIKRIFRRRQQQQQGGLILVDWSQIPLIKYDHNMIPLWRNIERRPCPYPVYEWKMYDRALTHEEVKSMEGDE